MPKETYRSHPDLRVMHAKEGEPNTRSVWIFKGQGFVAPGIGRDLFEHFDTVKTLYKQADEVLGFPISKKSFDDPDGDLIKTQNAQPATIVYNQARLLVAKETGEKDFQHNPVYIAGNSLGEYSGLIAAGALSFEDGLKLIKMRGKFMQEAQSENPGGLGTPLLSKDADERAEQMDIVDKVSHLSGIQVCLINSKRQIVYGGTNDQLEIAAALFKDKKIRFTKLKTDGAFHHPVLMESAWKKLVPEIDKTNIRDAQVPIISNVTGEEISKSEQIRESLKNQMINPVQWSKSMDTLRKKGFDVKIEIGEKSSFLDMVLEHPIYDGVALTAIIAAGGLTLGWKLTHPSHKKD